MVVPNLFFFLEVNIVRDHLRKPSDCEAFGASVLRCSSSCWLGILVFPLSPIHSSVPPFPSVSVIKGWFYVPVQL